MACWFKTESLRALCTIVSGVSVPVMIDVVVALGVEGCEAGMVLVWGLVMMLSVEDDQHLKVEVVNLGRRG